MDDRKAEAAYHPLPRRTPMEALASHGQLPPDPSVDRMAYASPGPAPWAETGVPRALWIVLAVAAASLLVGSLAILALTDDSGRNPVERAPAAMVTTTGKCEKRIIGEYGLVATVIATNGTGKEQRGQVWVQWPVTGETAQRFVKPVTLAPGQTTDFPVNQDIPAERWYRTGICTFGWDPQ